MSVFFSAGFRPFFFLSALYAAASIVPWALSIAGLIPAAFPPVVPAPLFHAHEMIFGYVLGVVGGFLLTAVPHWTSTSPLSGTPLATLVAIWLAGRAFFFGAAALPPIVTASVDVAFPLALLIAVAPPIYRAGSRRNAGVPLLLLVLGGANAAFHAGIALERYALASHALFVAIAVVVTLLLMIGGRIVPAFTVAGLRREGQPVDVEPRSGTHRAVVFLAPAALLALRFSSPEAGGALCLGVAALGAIHLTGWTSAAALRRPIIAVLHIGYGWVVVGLFLFGIRELFPGVAHGTGLHALTAGAMGTMTVAVMSRAILGHTGRTLHASPLLCSSYGAIILGALLRVGGASASGAAYAMLSAAGGGLWATGFFFFALWALPIVFRPRVEEEVVHVGSRSLAKP